MTALLTDEMTRPAHLWIPERAGSFGYEAIGLCEQAGLTFDPEQAMAIDAIMSHDAAGDWVASEVAIVEPRQNGKTNRILIPIGLWQLFMANDPDEIIWTAHRFKTSSKSFEDMRKIIDGCYELRRRVRKISESHGEESIELITGSKMSFLARSKSGGRGLGGPRPILDEAFALQGGQLGALLPTILARPNSQIMYASSAGLADSGPLREVRDRGREGGDPSLVYIEWCAPGSWEAPGCELKRCNHHRRTAGCALDREENIRAANPAIKRGRIKLTTVRTLRRSMEAQEFGREILGWWDEPEVQDVAPIKLADWDRCAADSKDPESRIVTPIVIALDVAPDRSYAAIAIAGRRADGVNQGELIRYAGGVEWLADELAALTEKHELMTIRTREAGKVRTAAVPAIVLDPAGPAAALLPDLHQRKIFPILLTARDQGAACGGLQDAVTAGPSAWRHLGQAQVDLAVEGAVRRDIGDGGWAFGRRRSAKVQVDICPLVALTMARWGLTVADTPSDGPNVYIL